MDKVFIRGLEVLTTIGVYEWEKGIRQKLCFDLEMGFDNRPAAATDDIKLALDYATLSRKICDHASSKVVELVETMAEQVAMLVLADERVQWVKVTLTKPGAVPNAAGVGVEILRHRTPVPRAPTDDPHLYQPGIQHRAGTSYPRRPRCAAGRVW